MKNKKSEYLSWIISFMLALAVVIGFLYVFFEGHGLAPEREELQTSDSAAQSDFTQANNPVVPVLTQPEQLQEPKNQESRKVYRWIDGAGNTVFGDKPPAGAKGLRAVEVSPNVVEFRQPSVPPPSPTTPQISSNRPNNVATVTATTLIDECGRYKKELESLQERMRRGYPARLSNYYHDKELYLRKMIQEHC